MDSIGKLIYSCSLLVLVVSILGGSIAIGGHASASHNDGGTLAILSIAEDQFHNWDFQNAGAAVDWPVTIVFGNYAEIDKVKNKYKNSAGWALGKDGCATQMWGHYNDGGGLDWDLDSGMKIPCWPVCGTSSVHVRLYAPVRDYMYNTYWGYYVFASSHRDKNEMCIGEEFGWSEDAEYYTVNTAIVLGWSATYDWGSMYNSRTSAWYGNHYVQNDGLASWVAVPAPSPGPAP